MSIFLCSISNVVSGNCPEDCSYCTQSVHHKTNVETYRFKSIEEVVREARLLSGYGALGFCLVTSGRGLDEEKMLYIAKVTNAIKKDGLGLHIIACCGSADLHSLQYLKNNGVDSYNHNLETSRSFFQNVCSTHTWEERFETCENAIRAGLGLCCGGIYGLGESFQERIEFLCSLKSLWPHTVSINFYIPNDALPIQMGIMDRQEALECIVMTKEFLPDSRLMISGGREKVFGDRQKDMFEYGVNAIVLGNYLTTAGCSPQKDLDMLEEYGLSVANECN